MVEWMSQLSGLPVPANAAERRQQQCATYDNLSGMEKEAAQNTLHCLQSRAVFETEACAHIREELEEGPLRSNRTECPSVLDDIKDSEMAYFEANGRFVATERAPRSASDATPIEWSSNVGFDALAWHPGRTLRGVYWVDVLADGAEFEAHGLCDVDGDGVPSHYTITRTRDVYRQTPETIY